mgnify:CR=1 FL=1
MPVCWRLLPVPVLPDGAFYAYAYPHPEGYDTHPAVEAPARWDAALGEYILPYQLVRQSPDPDAVVLKFLEQTHRAAAETAGWD